MTTNDDKSHRLSSGCHVAVGDVATGWGSFTVLGCRVVVGGCGCQLWVSSSGRRGRHWPLNFSWEEMGGNGLLSWI